VLALTIGFPLLARTACDLCLQYDIGLAINCLANIATPDLSRDLLSDVGTLLTHQRPYVRKKALLVMYKLFVKYPQGLRLCFDRIRERLDDTDNSVVSCAVNVICEVSINTVSTLYKHTHAFACFQRPRLFVYHFFSHAYVHAYMFGVV
jgi:Adaptin N terminal region